MFDILGIGFAAVDIYYHLDCLPRPDGFCNIIKTETKPGGSGANVIAQAAGLGGKCSFLTAIGDDDIGREISCDLYRSGIDTGHIRQIDGTVSSHCKILLDPEGQKCILIDPGTAGRVLLADAVNRQEEPAIEARVLYTDFCPAQLALPYLKRYHDAGMTTVVNMQMGLAPYRTLGVTAADILSALEDTSVFAPCYIGLLDLTGKSSVLEAHREIRRYYGGAAIYTLGTKGLAAFTGEDEMYYVPAYHVKAVDTTGAGDSFIGAFSYAYGVREMAFREALEFASVCAALTCTNVGARATPDYGTAHRALANWNYDREQAEALGRAVLREV